MHVFVVSAINWVGLVLKLVQVGSLLSFVCMSALICECVVFVFLFVQWWRYWRISHF